jgi:hypothetical protein
MPPAGKPIDCHNWLARVWAPLLKKTGVTGTFDMLRHCFVTALIQSGVNAKVAQTLAGQHSASFTRGRDASAVGGGRRGGSTLLVEASSSISVAEAKQSELESRESLRYQARPGEIRTPDPQVRR